MKIRSTTLTGKCRLKEQNTVGRNLNQDSLSGGRFGNVKIVKASTLQPGMPFLEIFPENYMTMHKKKKKEKAI